MNSLVSHINASYSEEQLKVTKEFKKDESVYQQGDPAVKYYRVVRGIVIIGSITEEGKMIFKSLIHEGEFFGDEVIGGLNTRLNFALAFSNEILIEEYKESNFWHSLNHQKTVLQSALRRNLTLQSIMESNASLSVEERVKQFLKELASKKSIKLLTSEQMVRMHLKHKEIAFICNSSRQCVSSIISSFQKQGKLRMDRSSFVISPEF